MATIKRSRYRKISIERISGTEADPGESVTIRNAGDISIEIYLGKDDPRIISYANMQHFEIREVPGEGFVLIGKY